MRQELRIRQPAPLERVPQQNIKDSLMTNDLVFSPGYSSDDGESRDQLESFLDQCQRGFTEDWTCKKATKLGDIHLFWFGKPANLIAAIGVSNGIVAEKTRGDWNQSDTSLGWFCGFEPLIALRQPVMLDDITSDRLLAKWWKGLPYRGGPKSIVDEKVAKRLASLIVSRNPKQTAIAKHLKPWLGAAHAATGKRIQSKSNWSDIGDLRKPHARWRVGNAARWFEKRLGLPKGAITFVRPTGENANANKTLAALRSEWQEQA